MVCRHIISLNFLQIYLLAMLPFTLGLGIEKSTSRQIIHKTAIACQPFYMTYYRELWGGYTLCGLDLFHYVDIVSRRCLRFHFQGLLQRFIPYLELINDLLPQNRIPQFLLNCPWRVFLVFERGVMRSGRRRGAICL